MVALLPGGESPRRSEGKPVCVATMPILYSRPQDFLKVASRTSPRSTSWMALLRWESGLIGSAQFRWIKDGWQLASFSLDKPARSLHGLAQRFTVKLGDPKRWLLVVSRMRVQCVVVTPKGAAAARVQVIQRGLPSLRVGARYRADRLQQKLFDDERKLSDARARAISF